MSPVSRLIHRPEKSRLLPASPRRKIQDSRSTHGWPDMRVRLKGVNWRRKVLADGSVRTYYWAWKSGPPLRGEPGSPEFIASYNEAVARKVVSPSGVLLSLLQQFQASQDFTDLADSTRRSYIALIKRIEFSDFPLSALKDRRAR